MWRSSVGRTHETSHGTRPDSLDTNPGIELAIKRVKNYGDFRRELRTAVNFLDSFAQHKSPGAHVIEGEQAAQQEQIAFGPDRPMSPTQRTLLR